MLPSRKLLTLFTLLAFLVPVFAFAAPSAAFPPASAAGLADSIENVLANLIFRNLDIPVTAFEIGELRTTRNMGNGEIALAYSLSHSSGYPVSYILHLRFDEQMGWGKIAKTLGVKLRGAADKSVVILRDGGLHRDADEFQGKIRIDIDDEDDNTPGNKHDNKPGKASHDSDKPDNPAHENDKPGKGQGHVKNK